MAQRVMDCGDAGHILISSSVADVLVQLSEWKGLVRDLGEAVVKHGVKLRVFNVYNDTVGNNEIPQKLKREVNSPMSTRAFGSPKQPTNLQAKPKFAAMLGLVPGIGAVYNGQYVKGLIHAVIFTAGLVIALKVAQHYFLDVLLAALLCFYLYMPVEAYKTAKAHSRTE